MKRHALSTLCLATVLGLTLLGNTPALAAPPPMAPGGQAASPGAPDNPAAVGAAASANQGQPTWAGKPEAAQALPIHYVDCSATIAGDGSAEQPFNALTQIAGLQLLPGEQLLFKRGTSCTGTLKFQGSGTAAEPIVVGDFGDAPERATIDAKGAYTVVHLFNQEHIVLKDLAITNAENPGTNRRGITVQLQDYGTGSGYLLENLDIHDIVGDDAKGPAGSQGIAFQVTGTTVPTTFDGVELLNNTLTHINRQAINIMLSTWSCRPEIGCTGTPNWLPATGVVLRGNLLSDIGGDGIVMNTTEGALVENNTIKGFNLRSAGYNAGLWSFNSNYMLAQFNDTSGGHGTLDGMAYDIDGGNIGAAFQYNFSHDNDGGFFLLCTHNNIQRDSVVRYNISQNDSFRGVENCKGPIESADVYNNTIYIGDGISQTVLNENVDAQRNVKFRNNIVYKGGTGTVTFKLLANTGYTLENNVISAWIQGQPANPGGSTANPLMCNPGTAQGLNSAGGYKLQAASPAIGAGGAIANNGGRDYFGAPVIGTTTVGAAQGAGC
ncbi:hypothetical protein [Arthrobacter sp. TWP1-1]|uniref:hypothetical protein n=1 Tax=Arthrobacter sp. TWP1-1 TaxID=2804568 RepID=UPI003CF69D9E